MTKALHSRFNPSVMPAYLLEQTLVQRHDLVRRLVEVFIESARSQSKHYVLLVGPRGIGKTHLAALVYHRLVKTEGLSSELEIAWLAEDSTSVGNGHQGTGDARRPRCRETRYRDALRTAG